MHSKSFFRTLDFNQRRALIFSQLIVCSMMACVGLTFYFLFSRVTPQLKLSYLPFFCFFISLETIISRRITRFFDLSNKIFYTAAEWITIFIIVEAYQAIFLGVALPEVQFGAPLEFIMGLLTTQNVIVMGIFFIVSFFTRSFDSDLEDLQTGEADSNWETGIFVAARMQSKEHIFERILVLGLIQVVISTFYRGDYAKINPNISTTIPPAFSVVAFIVLGLILMSQTQFSALRLRWVFDRTSIHNHFSKHWFMTGLIFFACLGLVVLFLPTNYSVGFFEILKSILDFIMGVIVFILYLLSLPIAWLARLFGSSATKITNEAPTFIPPINSTSQTVPLPWWEIVKSIFFWGLLIAIIYFSIRTYLGQNKGLVEFLGRFAPIQWLGVIWAWIKKGFRSAGHQIEHLMQESIRRLRPAGRGIVNQVERAINFRVLTPRQKVIYYYLKFLDRSEDQGFKRQPHDTPLQYENFVRPSIPEAESDLKGITEAFNKAQYSKQETPLEEPIQVQSFWRNLAKALGRGKGQKKI